jgi:hypothetical protein
MSFHGPEDGYVAELMNSRDEDVDVRLAFRGRALNLRLPAISVTTAGRRAVWRMNLTKRTDFRATANISHQTHP